MVQGCAAGVLGNFAAVDLGATSGRVVLAQVLDGPQPQVELTEVARFPNNPSRDASGQLQWDIDALWSGVLEGLTTAVQRAGRLDGIGIDSWAVDYGLVDGAGKLLAPVVNYRDERTIGVPERVFAQVPAAELYAVNGLQVQPFNTLFQFYAARQDESYQRAEAALLLPDLLGYWLTGEQRAEVTNASTTGLLDAATRQWRPDLAERLGLRAQLLADLIQPGELVGLVRPEVARKFGQQEPLPVYAVGSHDTASAVVGVPAQAESFAYISCGTWSLVGLELPEPVLTERAREANFTNELGVDNTVRFLKNVMGLWVLSEAMRWWQESGQPADLAGLLAEAAQLPRRTVVDINGAEFLPPGDMPGRIAAAAAAAGQPVPGTAAEYVRCILDSLAVAYGQAVRQAVELSGQQVSVVHLVGGGSYNSLLCQLAANEIGLPVVAGPPEAAALGNALVQARAAGVLSGDLRTLRAVGARGLELQEYHPQG